MLPLHRANRVRYRTGPNGQTGLQDFRWVENVMLGVHQTITACPWCGDLGDATIMDGLRIDWPSGIVHELKDVAAKQILTVPESPRLISQGAVTFQIQCGINQAVDVEASTDLSGWSKVAAITKISGTLVFEDAGADQHESRYYRVVTPP